MNRDKILDRIKKLLALSGNNPNEHEAASALGAALRMMAKHNVDHKELEVEELQAGLGIETVILAGGPNFQKEVALWYSTLVIGVAEALDCRASLRRIHVNGKFKIATAVTGYREDAVVADWLVGYLYFQINRLCETAWVEEAESIRRYRGRAPWASERTRMKNQYRLGMTIRVVERAKELYRVSQESVASTGTGLAVLKDQVIRQTHPELPETQSKTLRNDQYTDYFLQGARESDQIHLQRVVESQTEGDPRVHAQ